MNDVIRLLSLLAALSAVASTSAQTIVNPGVIERPVVRTVRVRTTVSAPANIIVPPPLVPQAQGMRAFELAEQGLLREIRRLRFTYLHERRSDDLQRQGLAKLAEYTATEAVEPLIETLRPERAELRNWLMEHLATRVQGEIGQAALTWLALYDEDGDVRRLASEALAQTVPANSFSRMHLTLAIQSGDPTIFERAAYVARELEVVEAIPHFIASLGNGRYQRTEEGPVMIRSGSYFTFRSELDPEAVLGDSGFPLQAIHEYEDYRARVVEYQRSVHQVDRLVIGSGGDSSAGCPMTSEIINPRSEGSFQVVGSQVRGLRRAYKGLPYENPSMCPLITIPVPPVQSDQGVSASGLMGDLASTTFVVQHSLASLAATLSPNDSPVDFGDDFAAWARWYNDVALPAMQTTTNPGDTVPMSVPGQP